MDTIILVKDACDEYRSRRRIIVEEEAQHFIAKALDEEALEHARFVRHLLGNSTVYLDIMVGIWEPIAERRGYSPPQDLYVAWTRRPRNLFSALWVALYVDGDLAPLPIEINTLRVERAEKVVEAWRSSRWVKVFKTSPDRRF